MAKIELEFELPEGVTVSLRDLANTLTAVLDEQLRIIMVKHYAKSKWTTSSTRGEE